MTNQENPNITWTFSLFFFSFSLSLWICLLPHWIFPMIFSLLSKYVLGFTSKQIEHYIGKKRGRSDMMPPARARVHRIRSEAVPAENSPSCLSCMLPTSLIPFVDTSYRLFWYLSTSQHRTGSYSAIPSLSSVSSSLNFRPLWSSWHCCVKTNNNTECFDALSAMTVMFPKWKKQQRKGMKPGDRQNCNSCNGLLVFSFVGKENWLKQRRRSPKKKQKQ